jgi:two-component system, chemotaxis family, protein-glutamate methylesterase/glutaminase
MATPPKSARLIRVLVAEDSPTVRALLVAAFQSDPELVVVGEAADGRQAVEMAQRLRPDVITMDVRMPVLDGLDATRDIMAHSPTPIVVVSDAAREDAVSLALDATAAGALTILPKPDGSRFEESRQQLVATVKAMADVHTVRRWLPRPPVSTRPARAPETVRLVAIAASTGGPAALRDMLTVIGPDLPAPIAVVQHIATGFVDGLVRWLSLDTKARIKRAEAGESLAPGVVYVAPDDQHLGFDRSGAIALSRAAPIGSFRPSATHLFESAAAAFGASLTAVVLTGMGSDGAAGLRAVHEARGRVFAQDEASSVVFGMAREAIRVGAVDEILPLDEMGRRVREWVG